MLLSILIPTYNRAPFLLKNLEILSDYLERCNFFKEIEIIISNNDSNDETDIIIKQFNQQKKEIRLNYFLQSKNIGLEKNALFCLDKAKSEYIMYLGDDDYLCIDYLRGIIDIIRTQKDIFCILPSTTQVFPDGTTAIGKDNGAPNKIFEAGFQNCHINARRGSQLSGVIHKRKDLYRSYVRHDVSNIYPFIYFVGFNSMRGKTMHLFEFPVSVSAPPQNQKDWDYGEDGLIPDIFDNFNKIPALSSVQRIKIGFDFLRRDHWRFTNYYKNGGLKSLNKLIFWNIKSKKIPFLIKFLIPGIFYFYSLRSK